MKEGHAIEQLKRAFDAYQVWGPSPAQRMAFYLLERDRDGADNLLRHSPKQWLPSNTVPV
ncbi:MAG: hypothetical protein Ct9H300mP14_14880 [Gammaproteobacteria bacterium]|nr:MAG: hypothetical protein Ct9H300mP14_14880 [Gammaproteobacteria bacterium]